MIHDWPEAVVRLSAGVAIAVLALVPSAAGAEALVGTSQGSFRAEPRKRRRRGIATIPVEGPPGRDECDSLGSAGASRWLRSE